MKFDPYQFGVLTEADHAPIVRQLNRFWSPSSTVRKCPNLEADIPR